MTTKRRFAEGTTVSPESSRAEIEKLLIRAGAKRYAVGWDEKGASITCELGDRVLRFALPAPTREDAKKAKRSLYWDADKDKWCQQETLRRWRCLVLAIKAKLEVVATGIETFEKAFLANIVLPNKQTVGEWIGPQIADAYEGGEMPLALGPVGAP